MFFLMAFEMIFSSIFRSVLLCQAPGFWSDRGQRVHPASTQKRERFRAQRVGGRVLPPLVLFFPLAAFDGLFNG
jgi:hypothetical protein